MRPILRAKRTGTTFGKCSNASEMMFSDYEKKIDSEKFPFKIIFSPSGAPLCRGFRQNPLLSNMPCLLPVLAAEESRFCVHFRKFANAVDISVALRVPETLSDGLFLNRLCPLAPLNTFSRPFGHLSASSRCVKGSDSQMCHDMTKKPLHKSS